MAGLMLIFAVLGLSVALCAFAAPAGGEGPAVKYVSNFTGPSEVAGYRVSGAKYRWSNSTEDGAPIEGTAFEKEGEQAGALYLELEPGKTFTTVEYSAGAGMPSDWAGYDRFVMNFENGSEFMINMWLTIVDAGGQKFFADNLWINRAKTRMEIPLAEFRTAAGKPLDLAKIASMRLEIRSAEKFWRDMWLFHFQLEGAEKPVIETTDKRKFFSFSPLGAPPMPGSAVVHEKTAYAGWRGYGWAEGTPALTSTQFKKPDRLTAAWVWQDLGSKTATFRVDLPDGKYRARFYGGNYNSKTLALKSFALTVNGKKAAEKAVDPKTYYTTEGHFMGLDHWYKAGENPYEVFVQKFYQTYDFDFEVKGGKAEFAWTKTLAAFGLLITPQGKDFTAAADAIEAARSADVAAKTEQPTLPKEPIAADKIERERGFVFWARNYLKNVALYDRPTDIERGVKVLKAKAARGERANVAFTITPLKDLGAITIEVSDLAGDADGKIPSNAVEVRALRYTWQGWPASVQPGFLFPTKEIPATDTFNQTVWLTVTVPGDAPAGIARGAVKIKAKSGGELALPFEVDVRPFALTEKHDVSYALWRVSDYNMCYALRYFLPEKMDYFRKLLDAECANMKAHGATAFYFNVPIIKGVKGPHVELDFTYLEEEAKYCKKYGFCDAARPGMVFLLPDLARYLMKETRYGDYMEPEDISPALPESEQQEEFSDLFNARYIDAVKQIHEFFKKKGLHVLLYTVDEPRERNINRWNRNFADTIRYCKLVRENIPDGQIHVDPMRDENAGVDYVPILDYVDVIGTHPWDQSSGIVKKSGKESFPILWYFNAIVWDRYDFGLECAAADAKGFWQWHYNWDLLPFQPFHSSFKWGATIPGPDGPFDSPRHELIATSIDDYRYLATLEQRIETARDAGTAESAVESAENLLSSFYDAAPPYAVRADYEEPYEKRKPRDVIGGKSLDQWRDAFAEHVQEIDAAMEEF